MLQTIRSFMLFIGIAALSLINSPQLIGSGGIIPREGGEVVHDPDMLLDYPFLSSLVKRYISRCIDLGGYIVAVPDREIRHEPGTPLEMQNGEWFYCVYNYQADYLFHSPGTSFYSQLGMPEDRRAIGKGGHEVLQPGGGELLIYPGIMEGDFLVSASVRKYLTTCYDLGGSLMAVPDHNARSEVFFTSEFRYGLWYCCIPDYYIDYLYLSFGGGSFSQMGLGERENAFALSYGSGLRIRIFGKYIIGVELKAFSIFRDQGRSEKVAFMLGGGFPL